MTHLAQEVDVVSPHFLDLTQVCVFYCLPLHVLYQRVCERKRMMMTIVAEL